MKQILEKIERANDLEIQQIMRAVERRYAQMFPQWDVIYMAVHKEPIQREADLQAIFAMLQKEKTDSLG